MTYTIEIPNWKPTSINKGSHWAEKARYKQADMQMIAAYACKAQVPKATKKRRVDMEVTKERRGRAPDPDNLMKNTLDGLKRCGYLVDDSSKWCEWTQPIIKRGERTETTIRITDL